MALTKGFVKNAGTTPLDTRAMDAAKLVRNADGTVRTGVLTAFGTSNNLIGATSQMAVVVARADLVTSRSAADGAVIFTNDGQITVPVEAAPAANSRIDVVYAKHNDNAEGNGDPNAVPVIEVAKGQAAASPTKPSIPTGAEELGTLTIPAGVVGMNASGVVVRNTFRWTTTQGGTLTYRNYDEMFADRAAVKGGQTAVLLSDTSFWERVGGGWRAILVPDVNRTRLAVFDTSNGPTSGTEVFTVNIAALPVEQLIATTVTGTAGGAPGAGGTAGVSFGVSGSTVTIVPSNAGLRTAPYRPYFSTGAMAAIARSFYVRVPANTAVVLRGAFDMTVPGEAHLFWESRVYLAGEY